MIDRNNIFRRTVAAGMNAVRGVRPDLRGADRRTDRRGSMAAVMAVSIPALVVVGGWAVDQAYVYYRYQLLEHAATAAA
jgi:hypothetical protein